MRTPKIVQTGSMPTRVIIQNKMRGANGLGKRLAFDVLLPLPEEHLKVPHPCPIPVARITLKCLMSSLRSCWTSSYAYLKMWM